MISSEVQRTLVKSPPELWAEISDPESLARHLGEFGEIRITRVQPEQKVEWEADDASGSIVIKPSGWGTKVRLTVERELSPPDADAVGERAGESSESGDASTPAGLGVSTAIGEPTATDEPAEPVPTTEAEFEPEAEAEFAPELVPEAEEPVSAEIVEQPRQSLAADDAPEAPRRFGFFARLFGRRRAGRSAETASPVEDADLPVREDDADCEQRNAEAVDAVEGIADTAPALGAPVARVEPAAPIETGAPIEAGTPIGAATPADADRPEGDIRPDRTLGLNEQADSPPPAAAELERAEQAVEEQVTAVLTGVLDRLGAAHHRPFSRA
jgi:hypothetical protein